MCLASTQSALSRFTSPCNEARAQKCGGSISASALHPRHWSVKHAIAILCGAYVFFYMIEQPSEEDSFCMFECCVVFAAACVHLLFQSLHKRACVKPQGSVSSVPIKKSDSPPGSTKQSKEEGVCLQAVAEAYQNGGVCSQILRDDLQMRLMQGENKEFPITPGTATKIIDICLGAHDEQAAANWVRFARKAGCQPSSGTILAVVSALAAADDKDSADHLFAQSLDVIGSDAGCYQAFFEQCVSLTDAPRVEFWLQRLAQDCRSAQEAGCAGILRACLQHGADQADFWMRRIVATGIVPGLQICNAVLFVCGREGDVDKAEHWLRFMGTLQPPTAPDADSYAAVIDACARPGFHTRAQEWFDRMIESGVRSNVFTHQTLIKAYARGGDAFGAEKCIVLARKQGMQIQAFGYNAVIAAASKAGNPSMAQRWLNRLLEDGVEPNVMSYNCVLDIWAKHGDAVKAQGVLELMASGPVQPDVITIGMVLHACAKAGDPHRAETIFEKVLAEGKLTPDAVCYNAIIHAFVNVGNISKAEQWLMAMVDNGIPASVVSYTTVIHAHARNGSIVQAERILQRMLERGVEANVVTFSALIQACSKRGDVDRAEKWFRKMRASGIKANDMSFSTMLNVFAKAGDFVRAEEWLRSMEEDGVAPNTVCYNNVIEACSKAGRPDRAESWLQALVSHAELQPTRKSFTIAAQGFSKAGRWQETQRIFQDMEEMGIKKDEFSLTVLLSSYNRARPSQAHRAEDAFRAYAQKGLPVTAPPVRVLRSMIGASRTATLLEQENVTVRPE